ncbi:hypothetical protein ACERK3_00775 [Phycisphaerales bacterium AB-hyl4]|uniref:Uncharacterized protein n=1 Tax=Natronomicrosphaera hydrolytica TaxID=3242702 RepID=A0ABV4U2Y0_9BACT
MTHIVNIDALPHLYPTHIQEPKFWESLGRAVATFGLLEEVLGKAIFALTATRRCKDKAEDQRAYAKWLPQLEHALTDTLAPLINSYDKAARNHPDVKLDILNDLVRDLRKASEMRNILCHGSWGKPDANGASLPRFVNRKKMIVDSPMDCSFLDQVQRHTAELACAVISTVTLTGLQFPGSDGPGRAVWQESPAKSST